MLESAVICVAMEAKTIMIQGTGSGVGKSVIAASLCRILWQDGHSVAPFKSQNMALNSYVTNEGGEMGRAQVVQAQASAIEPTVDMNPILLKPSADCVAQVIIKGRPYKNMNAKEYDNFKAQALNTVQRSLKNLMSKYDYVVIEGAGSPAEVNLQPTDIVNMKIANLAQAPVILVGDIDRGGVFASLIGTMELLPDNDKDRVAGFIINRFRGDLDLLLPGLRFLEERTRLPVIGVIPYFDNIWIEEEDALPSAPRHSEKEQINVAVIHFPHISNFTDFDLLQKDPQINLKYVKTPTDLRYSDLIVLPGSKNTINDLLRLRELRIDEALLRASEEQIPIIGICGGFQMLGKVISDPGVESCACTIPGLGLLDIETDFSIVKMTNRVEAEVAPNNSFFSSLNGEIISGYEIHMGQSKLGKSAEAAFKIMTRAGRRTCIDEGAISPNRLIMGTYIHGLFDNAKTRHSLIEFLSKRKNITVQDHQIRDIDADEFRQTEFDRLADLVRSNLDMARLYRILEGQRCGHK